MNPTAADLARYTSGVLLARAAYHDETYCHGYRKRRYSGPLGTCDKCRRSE